MWRFKDFVLLYWERQDCGSKIGGPNNHPTVGQFLTREQAIYIYKKVERGETVNTNTMEQEIEQERQLDKMDDTSREINPYKELIINNA